MKTTHEIDERGLKLTVVINTPTIFPIEDPLMPSIFPVTEPEIVLHEGVASVAEIFGKPAAYVNTIAEVQPEIVAALARFSHVNAKDLTDFFDAVFTSVELQLFEGAPEATLLSRLGIDQCLSAGQIDAIVDRIASLYSVSLSHIDVQPDLTIGEIVDLAGAVIFPVWEVPTIQESADTFDISLEVDRPAIRDMTLNLISEQMWRPDERHEINLSDRFVQELGCDSLDMVEIIMAIEDWFGIEVKDEEAEECITVASAVGLVVKMLEKKYK